MKRFTNIFKVLALTVSLGAALVSCVQEPVDTVAKAVLGDLSVITFAGKNPAPQTVTVISDGDWHTTAPSWITVDPSTGSGETLVTVTASDNSDAGGLLEPRKDTLIFSGNTLASRLIIIVSQEGDSYRSAQKVTVDKIPGLADGKAFVLEEASVAAVTTAGFVLSNGGPSVYAKSKADVNVGDKVSIKGIKGSSNGIATVAQVDECKVLSSGSYAYPDAANLNELIASYKGDAMDFVKVNGVVAGGNLTVTVNDVDYSVKQVDCPAELSISKLNGNKVELTGYTCGLLGSNMFGIITTAIKDNGPAIVPRPEKLLYAKWRFTATTMTAYQDFFGGTAGKTDATEGTGGLYVPSNVEGNGKIEYWQVDKTAIDINSKASRIIGGTGHPYVTGAWPGDYWLFSATDNYEYPAGTTLHIKYLTRVSATGQRYWMLEYFDGNEWKPANEYPVETETESGTGAQYNFKEPTSNVAVECEWTLAAPCREPMFRQRCVANAQANDKGPLAAPNGGTCRIADNGDDGEDAGPVFEVLTAPSGGSGGGEQSGLKPGTVVFEDDFEWIEPWATAAGAGDAVGTNDPSTTAPNVFTSAACDGFLAEAVARGYGYFWGPTADGGWSDSLGDDNPKVLYLQKNYLKFGKTSYSAGIKLPPLAALTSTANIELTFDWCWQVTGAYKPDLMTLVINVEGGGTYGGDELTSAQSTVDGESKIEWQHASATISGATAGTRISISPANGDPKVSNPDRKQNRWYLDNIKIVVK
jgi:hypothetical protein